jgi:hypothetical protein
MHRYRLGLGIVPLSLIWALRKRVSWMVACFYIMGLSQTINADYHSEMNTSVFLDWLQKKAFPKMQELGKKCACPRSRNVLESTHAAHEAHG